MKRMDRKTENQLRQEIAEVWALLDAERAGRAALIRRIEQEEQSVAVVREPIYWIDPDDDANLSRISRVGWSPLYGESPASIPAANLATLREKAAEADELRKDAGERDTREDRQWRAGFMAGWNAGVIGDELALKAAGERLDAAIGQGQTK